MDLGCPLLRESSDRRLRRHVATLPIKESTLKSKQSPQSHLMLNSAISHDGLEQMEAIYEDVHKIQRRPTSDLKISSTGRLTLPFQKNENCFVSHRSTKITFKKVRCVRLYFVEKVEQNYNYIEFQVPRTK